MTRRETLDHITDSLSVLYDRREAHSIAQYLIEELTGITPSQLMCDPDAELPFAELDSAVRQLQEGTPVQYVTHTAYFLDYKFEVRPGVLIPRPETEELAAWIIREEKRATRLLDIGTGSGCLAVTLAKELPHTAVYAADISQEALAIATHNARNLGAEVTFREADALHNIGEVFPEKFDVIVSNPPYVPEHDREEMHTNVLDHEPHLALFVPDDDILLFYREIARRGQAMLQEGGRLYFEIYHRAAEQMLAMLSTEGYTDIRLRDDMSGKPRMICCRKK